MDGCFPIVGPQSWVILYYFMCLITLASLPLVLAPWLQDGELRWSQFDVGDLKVGGWEQRAWP